MLVVVSYLWEFLCFDYAKILDVLCTCIWCFGSIATVPNIMSNTHLYVLVCRCLATKAFTL